MKFGDIITYHCQCCGSNIDLADGKCHYCGSVKTFRTPLRNFNSIRAKLFVDLENRKFYFHEITNIGSFGANAEHYEYVDASGRMQRIFARKEYEDTMFETLFTTDSVKKVSMIRDLNKPVKMGFEIAGMKDIFRFKAFMSEMKVESFGVGQLLSASVDLGIDSVDGWVKNDFNVVPETAYCPNCGARVTKQFGLCDYCGGWIEYNDRFERGD